MTTSGALSAVAGVYDVALVGTGLAPLVAANFLMAQGKTVLLLNPDRDFFLEDSELPLDPMWPVSPDKDAASINLRRMPGRLKRSDPERVIEELRPDFPGAVELWTGGGVGQGFHDFEAPHVRSRSRLWITLNERDRDWPWELLEELYVEAADAGLKPQIFEGAQAETRFPGFSRPVGNCRGLLIPKISDMDVVRYRNGLLEFVRERAGPAGVICQASQTELMPGGVRFYAGKTLRTARLKEGALVFWTPRMSPWVLAQAKKAEVAPVLPTGVRLWEQWSLLSRESLDPSVIGIFRDMAVWAEVEGFPQPTLQHLNRLAVLRAGALVPLDQVSSPAGGKSWGSAESFGAVSELCHTFLKWDRFSILAMKPRAIFEWDQKAAWRLGLDDDQQVYVIPGCDGPLADVVRNSRSACARFGGEKERV
ncbi:hypothetical protein WDW37_06510 [Bdellovibrionota bacterium FG-1]